MKKLVTICTVVGLTILTTSVTYALPSDNFNDNSRNTSLWNLFEGDPYNEWLDETSQRLEYRCTAGVKDIGAVYLANGWGLLTTDDFSFKVDFHNSFTSSIDIHAWANVMLGLVKDLANHAQIGASWDTGRTPPTPPPHSVFGYSYHINGTESSLGHEQRDSSDGTLYVSYNAGADEIYLSHIGYWGINASATISGVLKGVWGADVISPYLGGSADNVVLDSGDTYLDNFVVDSGTVVSIIPAPGAVVLGSIGVGFVTWLRRRRTI